MREAEGNGLLIDCAEAFSYWMSERASDWTYVLHVHLVICGICTVYTCVCVEYMYSIYSIYCVYAVFQYKWNKWTI